MKLTEIKNIAIVVSTEALVLKGGARDTRASTTSTASGIMAILPPTSTKK
jgi:hypothetical protein